MKWVTGWTSVWHEADKCYKDVQHVTGQLLHIEDNYLYIVDMEGTIHRRYFSQCKILDRKPDEAGPYR